MILLDELDLGKSFQKLTSAILESEKMLKDTGPYGYMVAYLNLRVLATSHIYSCTGEIVPIANIPAANVDDLKDINL